MPLRKFAAAFGFGLFLLTAQAVPSVQNVPESAPAAEGRSLSGAIPFKSEPRSFAQQSLSTFFITLALLGVTVVGLYYFRNQLQKKPGVAFLKPSALQIKERVRVNSRLTVFVAEYRGKELMFAQAGDAVTLLSEFPALPSSDSSEKAA